MQGGGEGESMRVCTQCGKENVAHVARYPELCSHEYEDIIAGLKDQLRRTNSKINLEVGRAVYNRNQTINQRNKQIKDLLHRLKAAKP
jgi:protein-arginine kinase activator protein McsA